MPSISRLLTKLIASLSPSLPINLIPERIPSSSSSLAARRIPPGLPTILPAMTLPVLQLHPSRRLIPESTTNTTIVTSHPRSSLSLRHVSRALISSSAEEPKNETGNGDQEDAKTHGDASLLADTVVFAFGGAVLRDFLVHNESHSGTRPYRPVRGFRLEEQGEIRAVLQTTIVVYENFFYFPFFIAEIVVRPNGWAVGVVVDGSEIDAVSAVGFEERGIPGYCGAVR